MAIDKKGTKQIADNRKARHDYFVLEQIECGIELLNTMVKSNVRPADLARKMNIKPQEVTRITDIRHATKIDTIQNAFRALGKDLVLELR